MTTTFEARSRWSLASRCPRMGAYALRGADPEEVDEIMEGYWRRGKQLEDDVAASFVERYGEHEIVRHKPIAWPAGVAHGDIFVKPERLAVEVKSTASWVPTDHHLTQLAGEVLFDDEADRGALILVNPSNLRRRVVPMPVVPDQLAEKVHDTVEQIVRAADPRAPLPERVCERPSDAISHGCPFVGTCFADWTPPDPVELDTSAARLAGELLERDEDVKLRKLALQEAEDERERVRAELAHLLEPRVEYEGDEVQVRITPVAGRTTYDVATALKVGAVSEEQVAPFRKVGAPHLRWKVGLRPDEDPAPVASLSSLAAAAAGPQPWDDEEAPF